MRTHLIILPLLTGLLAGSCAKKPAQKTPQYACRVEAAYPHDAGAYTQGLFIHEGMLYESTGRYGHSSLRRIDLPTGEVLAQQTLPGRFFAEGACVLNGLIYQLTWMEHKCFVYDLQTLEPVREFTYPGEGWGLCTDGKQLLMSDGSSGIRFINPADFSETRYITVTCEGRALGQLNELEYIEGEIWANVFTQDFIVRIDPATGKVTGIVSLHDLLPTALRTPDVDVLNGIAYDAATKKVYVTGKNWPRVFELRIMN